MYIVYMCIVEFTTLWVGALFDFDETDTHRMNFIAVFDV